MNEQPKSKWYWRLLRWGLIGLAVLATLVAVLITEENWRGKHDWEAYKRAAEARGERLDVASVDSTARAGRPEFFRRADCGRSPEVGSQRHQCR